MKTTKYNMVAFGIVFFSLSVNFLALLFTSVITKVGSPTNFSIFGLYNGTGTTIEMTAGLTLFFAVLMLSAFVHIGIYSIKQAVTINNEKTTTYQDKNIWWATALFLIVKDSFKLILAMIIAVPLLLVTLSMTVSALFMNQLELGQPLLIFVVGIIAYIPTQSVGLRIGKLITKAADKTKATITFSKTGFDIQFHWLGLKPGEGEFHIDFSELERVETMTFFEAQKYQKEFGPNVQMAYDQVKSMYKMKEKRPSTLFQAESGTNTLIKGPEIHYLFRFRSDQDIDGLVKAFNDYKKK
ncbi:hypothetical protein HN958_03295 [Candidatus Falkowbacteria bacterium]|jgi:hypothetical protein|nr:hypothetical protein [Candidatus Falkowbacteria bacterium]MBT7007502.1 hypothetical protein [Candidatus Falkowbacteria bacterium]